MEAVFRIVLGALLIAHGLVHLLWFAPNEDAAWPFRLDRSGLVPEQARRPVGVTLIVFRDRQFIWGAMIDSVILVLAVWRAGWTDRPG